MVPNPRKKLLQQAVACLAAASANLTIVELTINDRLASYAAGPEFEPHPLVADVLVRTWPTPTGARYKILEFKSLAGAQVPIMSRPTTSMIHVLRGSILIRRHDLAGAIEICEAGQTVQLAAHEKHGSLVLKDSHNLIVFSI